MNMRLLGARNLKEVVRDMVDASSLHQHIVAVPDDKLFHSNCKSAQNRSHTVKLTFTPSRREHAVRTLKGDQIQSLSCQLLDPGLVLS